MIRKFLLMKAKNKYNFVEQFEDSEQINNVQANAAGISNNNDQGYPIQLIRIRPSGKVEVDQKAMQIISSCDQPIGFVSLIGKYRTGKSFLLNKLLYLQGKGFRVDPSTTACTQGIWMWSTPIYNERQNTYLFFIDTQGSQSLTKDVQNDTKIFVLTTLISSYLIFNTVGSIDEKSISQLNAVTKLSLNILIQQNITDRDNQLSLYKYMPKFLWLLRDFTLQLGIKDGRKMTYKQYLEDCLVDQNSLIKTNQDTRKVRRAIVNIFKERDCVTLVRPAKQERDIQKLQQLPEYALRKQFIQGVNNLRQKIMREAGPKLYEGNILYGSSMQAMIQSYVKSMNSNGFPTIKTAWEHIAQDQGAYAYNKALDVYNSLYRTYFDQDEPKGQQIHKILINLRDQTITQFNRNISQQNEPYHIKLKEFLTQKQEAILSINRQLNDCRNIQILKDCASTLLRKINANQYVGRPEQLNKDIDKVVQNYKTQAKGQNKGQILSEFLANMSPIIIQLQKPPMKSQVQSKQMKRIQNQQFQQKLKIMEQKMKKMQKQLGQQREQNTLKMKQINELKKKKKQSTTSCSQCLIF